LISLVAQTAGDIRDTVFRGPSGILTNAHPDRRPIYTPSTKSATYRNGSVIRTFSADAEEGPAGSGASVILFDELFLYPKQQTIWDAFLFTLREGDHQQIVIASTPRPTALAKHLIHEDDEVTLITGSSQENTASPAFLKRLEKRFNGTRLGRQEMHAELLMDNPDAMFTSDSIEKNRITEEKWKTMVDDIDRIVVAVDPSTTNNKSSDLCGISVCASIDDHAYVLEDLSIKDLPEKWASVAVDAYERHKASKIVAESNQGGSMVGLVLRQVDSNINLELIHARVGKYTRMEPVSALYERGMIHHVGLENLKELEDEMTEWSPKVGRNQKSPDRVDALVYAITDLLLNRTHVWAI